MALRLTGKMPVLRPEAAFIHILTVRSYGLVSSLWK